MSRHTASRIAWPLVCISIAVGVAGTSVKLVVEGLDDPWHFAATDGLAIAIFFVSAVVGALVASRFPDNPIGWIFVALAVSLGLAGAADGFVVLALDRGRSGGIVPWVAAYSDKSFIALFATFLLVLFLFPNGRPLTRRWRYALWSGVAGLLLFATAVLLHPGELDIYEGVDNPFGAAGGAFDVLAVPGTALFCAALVASVVALVVRFRRAQGAERQQLKLLAAAAGFAAVTFIASWFVDGATGSGDLGVATTLVGILVIPVAIGVAMLRYRLYDIDRVISRTLVYGALTVILGAAYAGLVLAGQAVFSSFAGGSNLAIAVSTLVVAALFLPLRARVQRVVDRRFYRRRYDVQRTLDGFGARLRGPVELERLRTDLQVIVHDTMRPAHVSVWLRRGTL